MGKWKNQALTMHPVFFDPLNKKVYMKESGNIDSLQYMEDPGAIEVQADRQVRFRFFAPEAKTVEVAGLGGTMGNEHFSLKPEGNGYFSATVDGIKPGFHYHNWYVDGVEVQNPHGAFGYGCFKAINFFEMPEEGTDFYYLKEVPHGDVRIMKYKSQVNSHIKACFVYTPPGYEEKRDREYPVLYLQHGAGENETGWIWSGKLNLILDNLIKEKKCTEMIVVMCCGYSFIPETDPVFYPGDFDRELTEDCIPCIEKEFRVKKGRAYRAIAGLSMGSAQAMLTFDKHQNLFGYLGVFSGMADTELDKILTEKTYVAHHIFLSCGKGEERLLEKQQTACVQLLEQGISCSRASYNGFHEWHVWRESLREFAALLFKEDGIEGITTDIMDKQGSEPRTQISGEMLRKQTWEEQILFFDPAYKKILFAVDDKGNPAGRYRDIHHGVEIEGKAEVSFWFLAPDAEKVEVEVYGMKRLKLNRADGEEGSQGYWTVRLEGIEPGFHYHEYYVNGNPVLNPMAPVGYGAFKALNFFEMPETDFHEYLLSDIPHGQIHLNYYQSSQTGRTKMCYVYTPPGYTRNIEKRYPVLYLQHGGGENETGWIWQGKIDNIADCLIAEGRMRDMIIVMNSGYAFRRDGSSHHSLGSFDEELVKDCIPFIDHMYRTVPERESRAMAGLSMGGMQTQRTVFRNPEFFAWAGIFSGGLVIEDKDSDYRQILYDRSSFEKIFQMLFVACGTRDGFYSTTKEAVMKVKAHGIPLEVFEEEGGHDWTFWRHCAKEFLPKLFIKTI